MSASLQTQMNSSIVQEDSLIHEQDIIPLRKEDVLVPGIADRHPKDMPEMAFVIAFCIQYNEAVGSLDFLPEELEDAIMSREPIDLVERIHRYFLRNVLNLLKIVDKRYWIRKLNQHLYERIDRKEFIFAYNPLDRVNNLYHELSNFEKVMILKDLVMWQFKGSERIQTMWQFKESERIQSLHDLKNENIVRPVEVEVLGTDSKGSTYFYLGVGARVYREIPSADGNQQCIWEALTTTLQDLKDLISDGVEIDPKNEHLLYNRISKELIPDIESLIDEERTTEEAISKKSGKKVEKDNPAVYNRTDPINSSVEEVEVENASTAECENAQSGMEDGVVESGTEPILSVSMWSVTRPTAQTVHDIKCFPVNQGDSSSVTADSNGIAPTVNSQWNEDDVATTHNEKNKSIDQSNIVERQNIETSTNNVTDSNKRRMEEETSDDNDLSDFDDYVESNKRVKFGKSDDDVMIFESCYDGDITKRSRQEKGKEVLREHQNVPKADKGKSVLRHKEQNQKEQNQMAESSYANHRYKTANGSRLPKEINREIFRPGPEELIKLEWSLNHMFFEELEIFGEDSDSELSDCCDACITEVDHLLVH